MKTPFLFSTGVVSLLIAVAALVSQRQNEPGGAARQEQVVQERRFSKQPSRLLERHSHNNSFARTRTANPPIHTATQTDEPHESVFVEFDAWLEEYVAADSDAARLILAKAGEPLAMARRTALAQLIETDPKSALQTAVSSHVQRKLPPSISRHLEEWVSGRARFDVIAVTRGGDEAPFTSAIQRYVRMGDRTFRAHVYGRRLQQTSKDDIPVQGIALGGALAVDQSPVRVLASAELSDSPALPAGNEGKCPVSQETPNTSLAVESGGEVFHVCHENHVGEFERMLVLQEGGDGPAAHGATSSAGPGWTQGVKRLLFMRVNFPDALEESISAAQAGEWLQKIHDFFEANSYGLIGFTGAVTPLLTLPKPRSWYAEKAEAPDWDQRNWDDYEIKALEILLEDARQAAAAAGFDTAEYDLDCVHFSMNSVLSRGYVGKKGAWIQSPFVSMAWHELGHNLGVWHANAWETSDGTPIGTGRHLEYGNPFDVMGGGSRDWHHFNAHSKRKLGWLPEESVQTVSTSGTYRVQAVDGMPLHAGIPVALRIETDTDRDYWLEVREHLQVNGQKVTGALLYWSPWAESKSGTHLLDMAPGTSLERKDAAFADGQTFFDPVLGVKITPSRSDDTPPGFMDVTVTWVEYLFLEAASARLDGSALLVPDERAARGHYLRSYGSGGGSASFEINVPADGDYSLWFRLAGTTQANASTTLSFDGGPVTAGLLSGRGSSAAWQWVQFSESRSSGTNSTQSALSHFPLRAGPHMLRLEVSDQTPSIDALLLANDPAPNTLPSIASVADQTLIAGEEIHGIEFTVMDFETPAEALRVTASSSNTRVIPDSNLELGGYGANRTLKITPTLGQRGRATIQLSVRDKDGNTRSQTFQVVVIGPVQALINAASAGETITLQAGEFMDQVIINQDLVLQGAGGDSTVIDANGTGVPITVAHGARVTVRDLVVQNGRGCGIRNHGELILERVVALGSEPGVNSTGCGIDNNGALHMGDCLVSGHTVYGNGGGLWNRRLAAAWIENSTFTGNHARNGDGGGLANYGTLTLVNCTVSGNEAHGKDEDEGSGSGGGIANRSELIIRNSTIAHNHALREGGGIVNRGATELHSTLVAGNASATQTSHDGAGTFNSTGWNLFQSADGFTLVGDGRHDLIGLDPKLGPLQMSGGLTPVHVLLPGSPAIDQGNAGDLEFDQSGAPRSRDVMDISDASDGTDIGACEFISETALPSHTTRLRVEEAPDGTILIALTGQSGNEYVIEASSDLVNWSAIATVTTMADLAVVTDVEAHARGHRFYRAVPSNQENIPTSSIEPR